MVKQLNEIRRVVTGHDSNGRSKVLFDGPPLQIGGPAQIWTTKGSPADNTGDVDASLQPIRLETPENGSLFWIVRMTPGNGVDQEANAAKSQMLHEQGARTLPDRRPDMHITRTVDYMVVLEGQITLILDDDEVTLSQFDCVVQRGTAHCWENRSTEPALLMFVLVDAAELPN